MERPQTTTSHGCSVMLGGENLQENVEQGESWVWVWLEEREVAPWEEQVRGEQLLA
jgi:hypothetical protein